MGKPEKLLLFGDSLSDSGNAFALSSAVVKVPIPPVSAGYAGWFSNGLIQSEVAADLLGASLDNFAVGGARAVGSRTVAEYLAQSGYDTPEIMLPAPDPVALATDTYLGGQLSRYLADAAANPPEEGTAAAVWIGANDYNGLPSDASPVLVARRRGRRRQYHRRGGGDRADRGRANPDLQSARARIPAGPAAGQLRAGGRRAQRTPCPGRCAAPVAGGGRRDRRHEPDQRRDRLRPADLRPEPGLP